MMRIKREVLDYSSEAYIDVFENGKCILFIGFDKIKTFDCFEDAYNYWYNKYVM